MHAFIYKYLRIATYVSKHHYSTFCVYPTGAIFISQALIDNQTLLVLYMWNNAIGDNGIATIARSLSNSRIIELGVSWCSISVTGVRSLAASLSRNQNIKKIWLFGNPITVDGAQLIMKSAVDNGVCEYVGFSNEYNNDDEVKRMRAILDDRNIENVIMTLVMWV